MATQSRTQTDASRARSSKSRARKKQRPSTFSVWNLRTRGFVHGLAPSVSVSDRLKRETLGIVLVLVGVLSSWALGRGSEDGAVVSWSAETLTIGLGKGAVLFPIFVGLTAVRAFANQAGPILLFRHYFGGFLFGAATLGLLSFGGADMSGSIGMVVGKAPKPAAVPPGSNPVPIARVINIPKREPAQPSPEPKATPPLPTPVGTGAPLPLPDIRHLAYYDAVAPNTVDLEAKARAIEETLASFKVEATVREINPGPAVTQFALEPGNGVKVRRITELQNALALALAAESIRVEAPIPGMARVGLEIPNPEIATVGLREVIESPAFSRSKAKLPLPLGRDRD